MNTEAELKAAEDLYEQCLADGAAAEGCFETVYSWNEPMFKDLPEEEKQRYIKAVKGAV